MCYLMWNVARFDVFMAVKIQVEVFWVAAPCSGVVGCKCFWQLLCLRLEAAELESFSIANTKASHWTQFWSTSIHLQSSQPTIISSILMILFHLFLDLQNHSFSKRFPHQNFVCIYCFLVITNTLPIASS